MGEPLYNSEILRLALATAGFERLQHPQGSAERRSPVCGSRVTVDVKLNSERRIAELGQEVRACALGQASASLLQAHAYGQSGADLATARDTLRDFLAGARDDPGDWPGLAIFAPARTHSARHAAILLAFDAAVAATEAAAAP